MENFNRSQPKTANAEHRTENSKNSTNSRNSTTVNTGFGEAISIKQVAEEAAKISGKNIDPIHDPSRPAGPLSRAADISRAKSFLNWHLKVNLDDGLSRTYTWAEKKLNGDGIVG